MTEQEKQIKAGFDALIQFLTHRLGKKIQLSWEYITMLGGLLMRKKVLALTLAALFTATATTFAAVPNFEDKGSVGYSWHKFTVEDGDWSGNTEKMNANEFYGSVHLTGKWFLNGDYVTFKGHQPIAVNPTPADLKNTVYSFDLQYNLDKNVGLLVGYGKFERKFTPIQGASRNLSSSGIYGGIAASTDLGNHFTAYTIAKAGSKLNDWTLGIGYAINKDTTLDFNYRYIKAKGVKDDIGTTDINAKGFGVGLTYKF